MNRGHLNDQAQSIAKARLGREITQEELRLMPYLQYCVMNAGIMKGGNINSEEWCLLNRWKDAGWISINRKPGSVGHYIVKISYFFYETINDILWHTYIMQMEDERDPSGYLRYRIVDGDNDDAVLMDADTLYDAEVKLTKALNDGCNAYLVDSQQGG